MTSDQVSVIRRQQQWRVRSGEQGKREVGSFWSRGDRRHGGRQLRHSGEWRSQGWSSDSKKGKRDPSGERVISDQRSETRRREKSRSLHSAARRAIIQRERKSRAASVGMTNRGNAPHPKTHPCIYQNCKDGARGEWSLAVSAWTEDYVWVLAGVLQCANREIGVPGMGATPAPALRRVDQARLHRIQVDILNRLQ